jgi:hypothetical protein
VSKPSKAEREARDRFRELVLRGPCLFSESRPDHECDGELDPHHLIRKQLLRDAFMRREDRLDHIYAPEIGVPLCRRAHELVTVHSTNVFREEVPARAVDWALEHEVVHLLERCCPSLFEMAGPTEWLSHGARPR